ncbi:LytR C-terminal domain-containing protein [Pseudarthrobacter sp. O4]|uniref:LytR C-terminal domain-containing protein n=1 Tax=Pseudarthrobacter sp. O4 TaxID=3418417 RepID=UPI003CFA07C1
MTKYARDEFDRVPETPTRQGVHRAAAESRRRSLGPILAVGAAALVIGLVAFLFLPKLGFNPAGNSSAVTAEQPAGSPTASPAASATSPAQASQTASGSATPSGAASPTATPAEGAAVDKTQPVTVYNASGTPGLAGRVSARVAADGWVPGPLGNWTGAPQTGSVIFYDGPEQKANAEALASLLGIQALVDSAEFKMPLVVVLGPGFQ